MTWTNEHQIKIFWRGKLAAPDFGEDGYASISNPGVRAQLIALYCATDAILDVWKDEGLFVPGPQPLDKLADCANDPDFKEAFPNSLLDFVAAHGHEVQLVAGPCS